MGLTEWVIDWKNDCRWKSWTLNITVRLPQSLSGNFHQQESFCSKCYSRSQYSCQRAAFVFVLGQGNKLIGSPPSERGHGWVGEAPHRNLKPYKSAIVWATWSAQGNPNSSSRGSDLGVEGITARMEGRRVRTFISPYQDEGWLVKQLVSWC